MRIRQIVAAFLIVAIVLGCGGAPALAEYARLLSPQPNAGVNGTVEVSAGFESDAQTPVTRVILSVDGTEYGLKGLDAPQASGVISMLWDTTVFGDGSHGLSLYFYSGSKLVGKCYQKVQVANRREGALTPPGKGATLIQFKNLRDGERISGRRQVAVTPASSLGQGVFLSVHVDKALKLVSNRPPFEFALDTTELSEGTHFVEAQVRDTGQNLLAANTLRITVENAGTVASAVREAAAAPPARPSAASVVERPRDTRAIPAAPAARQAPAGRAIAARAPEPVPSKAPARADLSAPTMRQPERVALKMDAPPAPRPETPPAPIPAPITAQPPAEVQPVVPETASALPQSRPAASAPDYVAAPEAAREAAADVTAIPLVPKEAPKPVTPAESVAVVRPAVKPETKWQGELARAVEEPRLSRPPLITSPADKPKVTAKVEQVKPLPPKTLVVPDSSTARVPIADGVVMAALPAPAPMPAPDSLTVQPAETPAAPVAEPVLEPPVSSAAKIAPDVEPATVWSSLQPEAESGDASARPGAPAAIAAPAAGTVSPAKVRMALAPRPRTERPSAARVPTAAISAASTPGTITYSEPRAAIVRGASMVTLRMAMEQLGGSVSWDHSAKTATVRIGGYKLVVDARAGTAKVNGRQLKRAQVILANGRIHLSARELADGLKLNLARDPKSQMVRLSRLTEGGEAR